MRLEKWFVGSSTDIVDIVLWGHTTQEADVVQEESSTVELMR